ncbi:glycosyl transferase family 1 [Rufibacter sp. DG15C]|uniref:glycosyltransferase n=1 Tax=Rufibacter sp. DG15C TaxID=1379909 RepID=UPI00078D7294|nr:glycosyltransferase [Rufibacter sp. DG15C]AMM50510.1 glycosyl transferase family 1 [Rufibacter sp. DG15C]
MAYIVMIGPAYPFRGGIAAFNERLAQTWQAMGHTVEIITFTVQYPSFLFPGKSQFSDEPAPKGLLINRKLNSINPLSWIKVGLEIKYKRPDILFVRFWLPFIGPSLGTVARLVKANKHTKVIALTDNVIPHEHRLGDKLLTQYFVDSCDGFVSMSDSVTKDLAKFTSQKEILFQPHPIYDVFGPAIDKQLARKQLGLLKKRYILFFGFIRAYKGLDLLLEALADSRLKELCVNLVVAGEYYEAADRYVTIIEKNHLSERVYLNTEYIPDSKVAAYFSATDIVVQPYKTATQSGVTQIAYHYNKPMVVTNVGGLPEIVPHGKVGYVVNVNPKEIADAIVDYYINERESEMVNNIKEEKKRFSWEVMGEEIVKLAGRLNP